jgi:hypothetical protein
VGGHHALVIPHHPPAGASAPDCSPQIEEELNVGGSKLGMSDIGFFADIRYAILSNSKFSIPISADTDVDIWVIFPQT